MEILCANQQVNHRRRIVVRSLSSTACRPFAAGIDTKVRCRHGSRGTWMIRTVWLAIVCLALISALAAGKVLRAPAGAAVPEISADASTVGIGDVRDTLTKADRLDI